MVHKHEAQPSAQPPHATRIPGEASMESGAACSLYERALTMSFSEQLELIQKSLGFNRSQIAEVLQISRPTLYAWIEGAEPNSRKRDRLLFLLRLISRAGITPKSPLHPRFLRHPLRDQGLSLLEMLKRSSFPEEAFLQSLIQAREMTAQLAAAAPKKEKAKPVDPPNQPPVSFVEKKSNPVFNHILM